MQTENKVYTYIGFAKRSGALKCGANAISTLKSADLLILCRSASENARKTALSLQRKFGCEVLETEEITVEQLVGKENCKLIAITNADLASAIIENSKRDFKEIFGGRRG